MMSKKIFNNNKKRIAKRALMRKWKNKSPLPTHTHSGICRETRGMGASTVRAPLTRGVFSINCSYPRLKSNPLYFSVFLSTSVQQVRRAAAASMSYDKQLAAAKKAAFLAARLCQVIVIILLITEFDSIFSVYSFLHFLASCVCCTF